jgi:hypothetical protein
MGDQSTPIHTNENTEAPAQTLGWVHKFFTGPSAVQLWAGISMFVIGTMILGSLL